MTDSPAPTPMQTLILWAVIARGGEAPQKGLTPDLKKPDRDALVARRLLVARAGERRSITVEVTEAGWAWAAANTGAPLAASKAAAVVLRDLLTRVAAHMNASGASLAEVIAPPSMPAGPAPGEPLAERIRAAYLAETGGRPGARCRLSALRARLPDVGRGDLDDALLALARSGGGALMPLENPAELDPAEEAASVAPGGRRLHLLLMER